MRAGCTLALAALLLCLSPRPGAAYTLSTSVSDSCHELLTVEAFTALRAVLQGPSRLPPVPDDRVLRRLLARLPLTREIERLEVAFAVFSLVVGVRAPDTEGHSTLNLNALRRVHADPSPLGQYAHGLRGPADDGLAGDLAAVIGTRALIRAEVERAQEAWATGEDVRTESLYLDHYGQLSVPVLASIYHLGRALHALQDAHSHTLRTADTRYVVHVLNYVDAVNGTLEAHRDGLPHSGALDECERPELAPVRAAVLARSEALMRAGFAAVALGDWTRLELGLGPCPDEATDPMACGWVEYLPACEAALNAAPEQITPPGALAVCCTEANRYCDNPWLSTALEEQAAPYLGCASAPGAGLDGLGGGLALLALWGLRGRTRRRRRWAGALAALLLTPLAARAEAPRRIFVALEGHFAPLTDRPDFALLDLSFGGALRGGYAFGDWRVVGLIERNWWVGTEFQLTVDPGVLNVGVGVERLLFDGFIRVGLVAGTATLVADTLLDDAGATGPFVELRPGGFRWEVAEGWWITLDPLLFAGTWPVVRTPRLGKLQRRTTAGVEASF